MVEGIIKFKCNWQKSDPLPIQSIESLNYWRQVLYNNCLIGVDALGVGFGNISQRYNDNEFIITGSSTGNLATLSNEHYAVVSKSDICHNIVFSRGPIIASSESMTHAVLYSCSPDINAVVHVHSRLLWKFLIDAVPTTSAQAEYGSPEMAAEMVRLYEYSELPFTKLLVMAGHENGIVSFGSTLSEACSVILQQFNLLK